MIALRRVARIAAWIAVTFAVLAAIGAALFYVYIYAAPPEQPRLSGSLSRATLDVAGVRRSYSLYLPANFAPGRPIVLALHGSDGSAGSLRRETGYAFERLADRRGFALVYPNGFEGNWNACNIVGDYAANARNIDDVAFLTTLVDQLAESIHIDRDRAFAVGISRGGHMAFRLALEAPTRFRAVAAVAANLPAADNFKCHPSAAGGASVMIMNGMRDPLNPFGGGAVRILGLYDRGSVMSADASARFFVDFNHIADTPTTTQVSRNAVVSRSVWQNGDLEVDLVGLRDGGHSLPQPYRRAPRILGPTVTQFDGAGEIWTFFERQRRRAR